jgi:methyl-accepting chemotaxis protein
MGVIKRVRAATGNLGRAWREQKKAFRRRSFLTIGQRLWIGSGIVILLVLLLGGFGFWSSSNMLATSERMAGVVERAHARQEQGERVATWMHDVQQTQAELNRINRGLMQEMMTNASRLHGFRENAADPIGDLLAGPTMKGLAEHFPQAAPSLERLKVLHEGSLADSRRLEEAWRSRHDGLAPALNELKRTILYWNLKIANTIFIHSSMGELLYEQIEGTPLEQFFASPVYRRYVETFPELESNIASARRTNRKLYEASEELYGLMLVGKWDEVRKHYRDHFPSAIKSIAVDIDRILAIENASLDAQSRAFRIVQEDLGKKLAEAAGIIKELQDAIRQEREAQQELLQKVAGEVVAQSLTMTSTLVRLRHLNLGIPLALTVLLCIGGSLVTRSIVRPINKVVDNLSEIADGTGDLTRQLEVETRDEVGDLARSFNRFVLRLRDMVVRVRDVSLGLSRATEEIRSSTREVGVWADQQNAALSRSQEALAGIVGNAEGVAGSTTALLDVSHQSTSAAMQLGATIEEISEQMHHLLKAAEQVSSSNVQMAVSVKQIEGNLQTLLNETRSTTETAAALSDRVGQIERHAEQSLKLGEAASRDAERGLQAVETSVCGIESLQKTIQDGCVAMGQLGERSRKIGKILNVIDEISDQTRLLALNATIIAAQAGEQGRGFAVVAGEVRELADRTAVSTREVTEIIEGVQQATAELEKTMLDGEETVRGEVARSHEAHEALVKIRSSTSSTQEQMNSIVASTHEQAESLRSISRAVKNEQAMLDQITVAMRQFSSGVALTAGTSESMKAIAERVSSNTTEQAAGSRHISENMESMRDMIQHIETAARDQSRRCQDVSMAVEQIHGVARLNADRTVELQRVMEELVDQAFTLETEVRTFRVEGDRC